eukprot:TRINITY_DN22982_c0_g1_i3.p1 TRINITY_DN22982_c0_g1~~TRINITY_DN22982_c0_g1_i3.p1  ORF type:complete len:268 (+),score=-22.71 TRINITY_DN22982_c0_g1_i3:139-942(+)
MNTPTIIQFSIQNYQARDQKLLLLQQFKRQYIFTNNSSTNELDVYYKITNFDVVIVKIIRNKIYFYQQQRYKLIGCILQNNPNFYQVQMKQCNLHFQVYIIPVNCYPIKKWKLKQLLWTLSFLHVLIDAKNIYNQIFLGLFRHFISYSQNINPGRGTLVAPTAQNCTNILAQLFVKPTSTAQHHPKQFSSQPKFQQQTWICITSKRLRKTNFEQHKIEGNINRISRTAKNVNFQCFIKLVLEITFIKQGSFNNTYHQNQLIKRANFL